MTIQPFLNKHRLPNSYCETVEFFFAPLAKTLIEQQQQSPNRTFFVGINGCQGSGKSTLADYLVLQFEQAGLSSCAISIDDFYLTQAERQSLSDSVHPLFLTRGVPGTHDMPMAQNVLNALKKQGEVKIPRYDKAIDDRHPKSAWHSAIAPLHIVILEGWCVALPAQNDEDLVKPINELERNHDPDVVWRGFSNRRLKAEYAAVWDLLDYTIMLKAPSFDHVYRWRLEQEEKLRDKMAENIDNDHIQMNGIMSAEQIREFIAYYERLTCHALATLPERCDVVFSLDKSRKITQGAYR